MKAVDSQSYLQQRVYTSSVTHSHSSRYKGILYMLLYILHDVRFLAEYFPQLLFLYITWICLYTASWGGQRVAVLLCPRWTQTWSTQTFSALNKCRRRYQTYGANTSKLQDCAPDIISKLLSKRKYHFNIELHIVNPETQILLLYPSLRCKIRILDSFGTEPDFNHVSWAKDHNLSSPYGSLNLIPLQFYTMFRMSAFFFFNFWEKLWEKKQKISPLMCIYF